MAEGTLKRVARGLAMVLLAVAVSSSMIGEAGAKSGSSGSGGYSRPSSSGSTPSYRPPVYVAPPSSSAPSSGGYSRPSTTAPTPSVTAPSSGGYSKPSTTAAPAATSAVPRSAGDVAVSRQASGSALTSYRATQERQKFQATGSAAPAYGRYSQAPRYANADAYYAGRSSYYGGYGWSAPGYAYYSRPSFGMFDALFLWFMLDTVSNASHAAWFHNNSNDPGYVEWRREADKMAADNAELRAKLDRLDADLKQREGQPKDPNFLPPDVKPEVALAVENAVAPDLEAPVSPPQPPEEPRGSSKWKIGLGILALAGVASFFFWRRGRTA